MISWEVNTILAKIGFTGLYTFMGLSWIEKGGAGLLP
jgi:hypothetical protein